MRDLSVSKGYMAEPPWGLADGSPLRHTMLQGHKGAVTSRAALQALGPAQQPQGPLQHPQQHHRQHIHLPSARRAISSVAAHGHRVHHAACSTMCTGRS